MVLVTTDRQSAFDRVLASVPFKGQVRVVNALNPKPLAFKRCCEFHTCPGLIS
jgi:hypothetical protein